MAKKQAKTNAMRELDSAGISYETLEYPCDGKNFSGELVAQLVGLPCAQVFKTLVAQGEKKEIAVCCIPVDCKIDLKALAGAAGYKRLELVHPDELLALTGYVRGGCSPVGMKKAYPVFIDDTALHHEKIALSTGIRGMQLLLAPGDLIGHIGAATAKLTRD